MRSDMWALREFIYDEEIASDEVFLLDAEATGGVLEAMPRDDAIAIAHARGHRLLAVGPLAENTESPTCEIGRVELPLRWESIPEGGGVAAERDERLWFESSCGGRDLLVGNPHTFRGRMGAWCPHEEVGYAVSLAEMGDMSDETRYFVKGFLSGYEPDPPYDDDFDLTDADDAAWRSAIRRFRQTGYWFGQWRTCEVCGCVLLPDSASYRCHAHLPD